MGYRPPPPPTPPKRLWPLFMHPDRVEAIRELAEYLDISADDLADSLPPDKTGAFTGFKPRVVSVC